VFTEFENICHDNNIEKVAAHFFLPRCPASLCNQSHKNHSNFLEYNVYTHAQIITIGDAFVAARLDIDSESQTTHDTHKNSIPKTIFAVQATCQTALQMQRTMCDLHSSGLFHSIPGGNVLIRVGVHTGHGYGFVTGETLSFLMFFFST
jgi:hypothetical protein